MQMGWGSHRRSWALPAVFGGGFLLRVALMVWRDPERFDIGSIELVYDTLRSQPSRLYEIANAATVQWPYPGGYLPIAYVTGLVADATSFTFAQVHTFVGSAADLLLAAIVVWHLRWRGERVRTQAIGAGCILLAPLVFIMSAYHGPIDSTAFIPAVGGLIAWERLSDRPVAQRGLASGLLIGLGAAFKTVPGVLALALLPTARSNRERVWLIAATGLIPFLSVAPFLAAQPGETIDALTYTGVGGLGGLSMFVQPQRAFGWLTVGVEPTDLSRFVSDIGGVLLVGGVLVTTIVLWRRRAPATLACVGVVLALYVFGVNVFLNYGIWIVPFLVLAGFLRIAVIYHIVMLVPLFFRYAPGLFGFTGHLTEALVYTVFVPVMTLLWLGFAVGWLAVIASRLGLRDERQAPAPERLTRPQAA